MRSARPGVMALLLVVAIESAAQAPPHLLGLSSSAVHALDQERAIDLQAIDSFAGKRRIDGVRPLERPGQWTLFGRVGPMNFANQLDPGSSGVQVSLRRNSHGLSGNIYIGLHRRF